MSTENLIGTFDLSNSDDFQFVYGSQNYGTFYSIYAKLLFENNFLNKIIFKLINYKGLINIGFKDSTMPIKNIRKQDKTLKIALEVKATSIIDTCEVNLENQLNVGYSEIDKLLFRRFLHKIAEDSRTGMNNSGVFDTEYYKRSGEKVKKNKNRPEVNIKNEIIQFLNEQKSTIDKSTGEDCKNSYIRTRS